MKPQDPRDLAATKEARDEVEKRLDLEGRVGFFPVRHHSPTCAAKLEALLPKLAPDVILVEAPARFEGLLEALVDPESVAPFALLAVTGEPKARWIGRRGATKPPQGEEAPVRSYYPFCDYSPELVALRYAAKTGAKARFIDKIGAEPEPTSAAGEETEEAAATRALGERLGGASDRPLARSRFTAELARRVGCRDFDELWEVLFEQGAWDESPARWAAAVGAYALSTRATYTREELEAEGTIARERFMAEQIASAAAEGERVLVIAGAMHAVGLGGARDLLNRLPRRSRPEEKDDAADVFLVPYTFPRLDALLGYAPGMSGPAFYQRVWEARAEEDPFARAAEATLLETIRRAREAGEVLGSADAIAALAFAQKLASLRGRPRVGWAEVIEAATTCFVKGEVNVAGRRILASLAESMRGARVGKLGPRAGTSAIAADFRATAEALGLFTEGSRALAIELDLARTSLARRRSYFLHRAALLELGFAKELGGADLGRGELGRSAQERWSVTYVPEVDARLAEIAAEGASVEEACARRLARAMRSAEGRAGEIAANVERATRLGVERLCKRMRPSLEAALRADEDAASLLTAARRLRRIGAFRARIGRARAAWLEELGRAAYEEGTRRLERIASGVSRDKAHDLPALLVDLAEVTIAREGMAPARELVADKARAARRVASSALAAGALDGLLVTLGASHGADLAAHFRAFRGPADSRGGYLEGLLALAPRALMDEPALFEALIDHVLSGSFESFLNSLPPLRRALSRLGPREIEELAARGGARIGLVSQDLADVTALPPEAVARLAAWERRLSEEEARWAGSETQEIADAPARRG